MFSTLFVAIRVQASSSFSRSLSLSLSVRFADVAIVGYSAHGGAGEESRSCRRIDGRTNGRTELRVPLVILCDVVFYANLNHILEK